MSLPTCWPTRRSPGVLGAPILGKEPLDVEKSSNRDSGSPALDTAPCSSQSPSQGPSPQLSPQRLLLISSHSARSAWIWGSIRPQEGKARTSDLSQGPPVQHVPDM